MDVVERDEVSKLVVQAISNTTDDNRAADLVQQGLVKRIMNIFLPLYERQPGLQGFVSIQGNPQADEDSKHIVDEALRYRELGKNFIAKIPVTEAGLRAMEALIAENMPTIATEVMGIAQAIEACEMYQRVSASAGVHPPFYLTHITGILDEHLTNVVRKERIEISPGVLSQAGCIVARKQYRIFKERNYPGTMLGGGARGLHHFTEMVGGEIHITINWKGTADKLIELNPLVADRVHAPAPQEVVDELLEKIPDFAKAYIEDGLSTEEFRSFGPVVLFRSSFIAGWQHLLDVIKRRRAES